MKHTKVKVYRAVYTDGLDFWSGNTWSIEKNKIIEKMKDFVNWQSKTIKMRTSQYEEFITLKKIQGMTNEFNPKRAFDE